MICKTASGAAFARAGGDVVRAAPRSAERGGLFVVAMRQRVANVLKHCLLPAGFPESVTRDYAAYQTLDSIQAACSYLRGTFATAALFKGVGVGDGD
jgi:hypothetical protein